MFRRAIKTVIIVIILSAFFGCLPVPVYGQDEIDLVLGGAGSTSWDIQQVKPGDSGTKVVELRNDGSSDGQLTIWITDIESTEGTNPESETGDTSEPGELINYIKLNCSAVGLTTNIALPVTVDNLPQNVTDANYIRLDLDASQTVTLTWEWEFEETGQPQNDAQGDCLSFSIYYYLEEVPAEGGVGPVYYVPPPDYQQLEVVVLDEKVLINVTNSGRVVESMVVTDDDSNVRLELERGTVITGVDGSEIIKVETRGVANPAPPADGTRILSEAIEIIGYTEDSIAMPILFDKPALLKIPYNPDLLPEGKTSLFVAVLDSSGNWQRYGGLFISNEPNAITAIIDCSSVFAVLAVLNVGNEVTDAFVPMTSEPGDPAPVQVVPESPETPVIANPPPAVVAASPLPPRPKMRAFILPDDIVESWKSVSLMVMVAGSAVLIVLGFFERRRQAHGYFTNA